MGKKTILLLLFCFFVKSPIGVQSLGSLFQKDPFLGNWENEDKTLQIMLYRDAGTYHGKLISFYGKAYSKDDRTVLIQMVRKGKVLYGGTYRDLIARDENEARIKLINDTILTMKIFNGLCNKHSRWRKINCKAE